MRATQLLRATSLALIVAGQSHASETSYPAKIEKARAAVVEVLVSGVRQGTGFCVSSDGAIVTATHVVGVFSLDEHQVVVVTYRENLSVRFANGYTVPVKHVENTSVEAAFHDISVLKADEKTTHFLHLGTPTEVRDGDEVYTTGFPFDVPVAVTYRGNVSAQFPMPMGTLNGRVIQSSTIHIQMPIARGFSGAPLLRMSDDSVVGVVTNKLGGISQELSELRESLVRGQASGNVKIMGVDPNQTSIALINVLDTFLSAGAGWATSIEYAKPILGKSKN